VEVPRESGRIFAIIYPDGWELQLLKRMKIHPLFRGIARDMRKEESGGEKQGSFLTRLGIFLQALDGPARYLIVALVLIFVGEEPPVHESVGLRSLNEFL
tara:strand:+ start:127 stop:426 length:300 start_codon:yes stop_codon:yes gene_type:complete